MEKVKVLIGGCDTSHPFFSHLPDDEKQEIENEILKRQSVMVLFRYLERDLFAGIYTITPSAVHLREAGGAFVQHIRSAQEMATILAKMCGKSRISFCTKKQKLAKVAIYKLGFEQLNDNEFYKELV